MKIIHTADIHLDSNLKSNFEKVRAGERRRELLITFERLVAYAAESKVDVILIAGDMFDTRHVSATTRNSVLSLITGNPKIGFYYLKGNHDTDSFIDGLTEIPENLHMFSDAWDSYELGTVGDRKVVLTGAEMTSANVTTLPKSLALDVRNFNIVMLHGQIMKSSSDKTEVIPLPEYRNLGIDYMALGHIHGYRFEELDKRASYCYPGCLEPRGYDEAGKHGFELITISEDGKAEYSFHSFSKRRVYVVEADVTDCVNTDEIYVRIKEAISTSGAQSTSMVKVILKGEADFNCELDLIYLTKKFEDDFYSFKIEDQKSFKVNFEDFSHDLSLKGEFVRTVQGLSKETGDLSVMSASPSEKKIDKEDAAEIVRIGLAALSGGEV